jgi:Uma2 family endonuclease
MTEVQKARERHMARNIEDEVVDYYYDSHPTMEDLMGETSAHADLVHYLVDVLRWLFHKQVCAIYENLNFYVTKNWKEYPLAPDIAVIKGIPRREVRSWSVGKRRPAPHVVFEVASEETWRKDLEEKPERYAHMGVLEYFAYDPNEPILLRRTARRLYGWELDPVSQMMREKVRGPRDALWSSQLESWLVPDGAYLRLYDKNRQMRLTQAEAQALYAQQAMRKANEEAQRAQAAMRKANEEARRAQLLAEKLRSLGIDPDQIE